MKKIIEVTLPDDALEEASISAKEYLEFNGIDGCEFRILPQPIESEVLATPSAGAVPRYPSDISSIEDMCKLLDSREIKASEYTDCTILYEVTFEQLRNLYDTGRQVGKVTSPVDERVK